MKVYNITQNVLIAARVEKADTALSRLIGLLQRSSLDEDEGLIITQCRSIHMFFMRFPIDAVFVNKNNVVIGLVENIKPFRMSPYFLKASHVLELHAGIIQKRGIYRGDILETRED